MKQAVALHKCYLQHGSPNSLGGVVDALRDVCDRQGIAHLAYFSLDNPATDDRKVSLITTCGESWVNRYFERKYYSVDPVLTIGSKSILPMDWSKVDVNTDEMKQLYSEASDFGVGRYGLTVRVRGHGADTGLVSISLDCTEDTWRMLFDQTACELLYLAVVLHSQVISIQATTKKANADALTQREREVLEWAARGKTAWETGCILGVKERTVSFYIANACDKLGVSSKTHAVAKLVSEQKIFP